MPKIINKEFDSLDIGILPAGGTKCAANWEIIWRMFKDKYPNEKEIVLEREEFTMFVRNFYERLILENIEELTLDGVKIIKSSY